MWQIWPELMQILSGQQQLELSRHHLQGSTFVGLSGLGFLLLLTVGIQDSRGWGGCDPTREMRGVREFGPALPEGSS